MGFLTNVISAAVKTVASPVATCEDVISGTNKTKKLLESAASDVSRAADTLFGENEDGLL